MHAIVLGGMLLGLAAPALGHDIPNARVDRSIQATLQPDRLRIDYEVSLSELTLTRDLRSLIGTLPGSDRQEWFERYGQETGPLNARGFLVSVNGELIDLAYKSFDLTIEQHPKYIFHFEAELPDRGRLTMRDTNFAGSEGTSRLALRRTPGVQASGDDLPQDVEQIPIRPVWMLTDAEEARTRQIAVNYEPVSVARIPTEPLPKEKPRTLLPQANARLSHLLDRSTGSFWGLIAMAVLLGAAHSIQPGHGKTLVAATTVGQRGGWARGVLLALIITVAHMAGVLAIAAVLWVTQSTRYAEINHTLAQLAGFVIAAIGLWRLGRHLGGHGEHEHVADASPLAKSRSLLGLGLAGGMVPCWDAVVLIVLAEALGRLALGIVLLAAFSLGMAGVLVLVGLASGQLRGWVERTERAAIWERRLGIAGALVLTAIGLYLLR